MKKRLNHLVCLLFQCAICLADSGLIRYASNVSTCTGNNVTLDWTYDTNDVFQVTWSWSNVSFLIQFPPNEAASVGDLNLNVRHINNGKIVLINPSTSDSGLYSIVVLYINLVSIPGIANVTIKASPSSIKGLEKDLSGGKKEFECTVEQTGEPPVHVQIKVGNDLKDTNIATADLTLPIDCCVVGEAATCLLANTNKSTTYCENIHRPYGPENLTLTPSTAEYILDIGDELNGINCSAECSPSCTYVWYKDGTYITSVSYLSPRTVHTGADRGTYTCTATRPAGNKQSTHILVHVRHGPDNITMSPPDNQYEKKENDSITDIFCQADCYPNCTYSWYKNGEQVSPIHVLSLGTLQRGENGTYACTAKNTNTGKEKTRRIIIIIRYGPDSVTLDPADRLYTEPEKYNFPTITCQAHCYPDCVYKWEKLGIVKSNNNSLAIGILERDETGNYTCTATNPSTGMLDETTVTVFVQYGPDDIFINSTCRNCTTNEGFKLPDIRCEAKCFPGCSYKWTKNGTNVSSNASLALGSLDKNEAGNYLCIVRNTDTQRTANASIIVNVRYGPDEITFSPQSTMISLSEGELFPNKSCTSDCYPGCSQSWTNIDTETDVGMGHILALGTVYRNYTAEYRCTSTNQVLQKSKNDSIFLTVKYFPDVKVSKIIEGQITELNESFTIQCVPKGVPDKYTYFNWTHLAPDGHTKVNVHKGQVVMNRLRLTKEHPTYMDSGVYLCKVTNGEREYPSKNTIASSALNVTVKGKPLITESQPIVDGATGKHVQISVSFFSNDGTNPSLTWFKIVNDTRSQLNISSDGKFQEMKSDELVSVSYADDVFVNQSGKKSQLEIANIEEADFGYYEIEIVNSIGNLSYRLELVPRGPPSLPINFTVVHGSETAKSITLMWFPGFHGGASQTFHIEYKTNSTQWKKGPVIPGGKSFDLVNATVWDLLSGTEYIFQLYSINKYGRKNVSRVVAGTTSEVKTAEDQVASSNVGVITGAAAGGVALAVIVVLVLLFLRRRRDNLKSPSKRLLKDNERPSGTNDDADTPEINLNPMYESAGPLPSTSNNTDLYSQVEKNRKKAKPVGDIYSQVDKLKKRQNTNGSEVKNDVYAQVQKKTHKEKNAGKTKHKKQRPDKTTKKGKQTEGDLYDNVDTVQSTITKGDNVYENPTCGIEDEHAKQRNEDGLIYVDLDLPKETVGKDREAIIHGLENRTDYADIKFGEVGELAPGSDEENKNEDS